MILFVLLLSVSRLIVADFGASDHELMMKILKSAGQCLVEGKVNLDLCSEMLKEGNDNSQEKYNLCKCTIPCVAKKLNLMSEEGKFLPDEIEKLVNGLQTPNYKEEGVKLIPICKSVEGMNCEAGFNLYTCIMDHSPMAKDIVVQMVKILKGNP